MYSNNFNRMNLSARLDNKTGATIWAKSIFIGSSAYQLLPSSVTILDDNLWILIQSIQGYIVMGGFMKLDSDGNIIQIKVFSNTILNNSLELRYFLAQKICSIQDENPENSTLIIYGAVNYGLSGIGYSEDSYVDIIIMSADINGNLLWANVFDYKKMYDSVGKIDSYEYVIYTSIYAGFTSPTLISLNGTNGNIINVKMFTYFQMYVDDA